MKKKESEERDISQQNVMGVLFAHIHTAVLTL